MANRQQRRAQERAEQKNPARKGGVFVALATGGNPEPLFLRSMLFMQAYDALHSGHLVGQGTYMQAQSTNVSQNRNQLVRKFLETGIEWLWFIDDDMVFEDTPDILDRMLEVADPVKCPILGALCFSRHAGADQEIVATIYSFAEKDGETKLVRQVGYPRDQLVQVNATGTGCLLVHRRVFVELARRWQTPWPWFDYSEWGHAFSSWGPVPGEDFEYAGPGDHIGEDITFCIRAQNKWGNRDDYAGDGEVFPIHVDTRIKVGHVKPFVVDESEYALRHPLVKANPPTFVIIPVKGEHQYTESLLRQLAAQKHYHGIFVFDNGSDTDPYTGYLPDQCEVIPAAGLNIHEMWNLGIRAATRLFKTCNLAILNNDLNIGPRFLQTLSGALRSHDELWAVSPNYDGRDFEGDILAVKGIAAGRMDGTGGLAGFAFMVKGELFDHGLPLFWEELELWYGDNDFAANVETLGGILGIVKHTTVEHIDGGSKTAGADGKRLRSPELEAMAARDRVRFEEKWSVRTVSA
jgi:hypothetical protein